MLSLVKNCSVLALVIVLLTGCKKNNDMTAVTIAPPPNDIVETTPPYQRPITIYINEYISGYYEALPTHYQVTTKKYPLLIFLPGDGQLGNGGEDLPLVLNDGVAKEINQQKFPASFTVKGTNFSYIVLSPQFRADPPDSMVLSFVNYAIKNYRIDTSRIYISGLSAGGANATVVAGHFPSMFAAVAPIAGASIGDDRQANAAAIAKNNVALWVFHNSGDPQVSPAIATDFVDLVNSYKPMIVPKLTLFNAFGHDAWTEALDPLYKENNLSVYEWMLQYHK